MRRPGLGLFDLFNDVGLSVKKQTAGRQQPWVSSSPIDGGFYFGGPVAAATEPISEAERTWGLVEHTASLDTIDDYIRRYGNVPIYGPLARARRVELTKGAAKTPPSPPPMATVGTLVPPDGAARAQEGSWKPGDTFRECAGCPEMVVVPAGSFTMGSPLGEQDAPTYGEKPQHVVTIARPFAVGKFDVTRDQFAVFARETRFTAHGCAWSSPGYEQDGSHPVVCVSFDDAKAYVEWLAKRTRKSYHLLSEAEWEYVARGQTLPGAYPRFWFGDNESDLCRYGNFADLTGNQDAPCNDGYKQTSPAGHYQPNAFGLYDMFGNVQQLTGDCWHKDYTGAPTDGSAWITWCDGNEPVVRGGWYASAPAHIRAAARGTNTSSQDPATGFRVARTLAVP
jgi:formylglycine-generating enzyme required for sulfatase activity